MTPDLVNASFEALAGLAVLDHCRVTLKDKQIHGVSLLSVVFFTTWGLWNMFYYPHLDQWASFAGGLFIVSANFLRVWLILKYRQKGS